MKTSLRTIATIITVLMLSKTNAQNIFPANGSAGIGTTSPNASSILDIVSTTKGFLPPRMTKTQRDAIVSPATGLIIYLTSGGTPGLYYYTGSAWSLVSNGANASLSNLNSTTKVNTNLLPDSNGVRALGNSTHTWKNIFFNYGIYQGANRIFGTNGEANTFLGVSAGNTTLTGAFNTALGNGSLTANTSGYTNSAIGASALNHNTTGSQNTSTGFFSLYQNTTGVNNTANGVYALTSNTTGNENTASGVSALSSNTTGSFNVANGISAMASNTIGGNNTAVGYHALGQNVTGYSNTAVGFNALDSNTSGGGNVAVGDEALNHIKFGNYNIGLGVNAGQTNPYTDNNIIIGFQPVEFFGTSNAVQMGNTSTSFMVAQVQWSSFSDRRIKDNIKENVPGLAFINKLKPVTYHLNIHRQDEMMGKKNIKDWKGRYDIEKKLMTGFVAQDVEQAAKEMNYDFSGVQKQAGDSGMYSLTYSEFVVPLVKAVQELSKQNNDLQKQIDDLKALVLASNNSISSSMVASAQTITLGGASLEQNTPNPFSNNTIIHYTLPAKYTAAQIIITDKNGKTLKQATVSGAGKGALNIDASTLSAGTYNYTLLVDGKQISTKQMVLIK